jgi:hypothetical protein
VSGSSVRIPVGADTIDAGGAVVTAGFWNSHVHILTPTLLHAQDHSAEDISKELATLFTRWGFTTVFDLASSLQNTNFRPPDIPPKRPRKNRVYLRTRCGPKPVRFFEPKVFGGGAGAYGIRLVRPDRPEGNA